MAKISKNRNFKMVTGFIMTFVMILSLFAGIGAIFVKEDSNEASASVLESGNKFRIPATTGELGTSTNPFVVLEVVPNENMAQMGYLVSGQEPVDINKLEAADTATWLTNGTKPLTDAMVNTYKWLEWKNGDTPKYSQFSNVLPDPSLVVYKDTTSGNEYTFEKISSTQKSRGVYTQYGYYELAEKDGDNYTGHYKLVEHESEVETIGDGYGYYAEVGVGIEGIDPSTLTEEQRAAIEYEKIDEFTQAKFHKNFSELTEGEDYVKAANGDIYFKVDDGDGVYSDKIYKRKTYTVRFMDDGHVYTTGDKTYEFTDILAGDKLKADQKPATPVKEGNTFSFWSKSGETTSFNLDSEITEDLELVAQWNINFYTVKFETFGGTDIPDAEVIYNTSVSQPADPEKTGYDFKGWYSDSACTTKYKFTDKVKGNITIYAKWEKHKYKVTFTPGTAGVNATNMPSEQTVEYQDTAEKPANPTWTEYRFKEWQRSDNGAVYNFTEQVTEDIELVAIWKQEFTVTFDFTDGTTETRTVASGDPVFDTDAALTAFNSSPKLTKANATFAGWYKVEAGTVESTQFDLRAENQVTSTVTLRARWTCEVKFDSHKGASNIVKTVTVFYGETVPESQKPTDPTWDAAHTFIEWRVGTEETSEKFIFSKTGVAGTTITSNRTIYAAWKVNGYKVKFELRGGTYSGDEKDLEQVIPAGNKVSALDNSKLTKSNTANSVAHWKVGSIDGPDYDFNQTVNSDLTLYASWNVTVTFIDHSNTGGWGNPTPSSIKQQVKTVEEGSLVTPPETNPRKPNTSSNRTFKGWLTEEGGSVYFDFNTPILENKSLHAKWGNSWTVIFNANGGKFSDNSTIVSRDVNNGDRVPKSNIPTPTRDGYTFEGWMKSDGTALSYNGSGNSEKIYANMTLMAKWAKSCVVTFDGNGGSPNRQVKTTNTSGIITNDQMPTEPTRTGYYFDGWYLEGETNPIDLTTYTFTADVTVKAGWSKLYKVIFNSNGGSSVDSLDIPEGYYFHKPDDPTKTGFSFSGWQLSDGTPFEFYTEEDVPGGDESWEGYSKEAMPDHDLTLNAVWVEVVTIYETGNTLSSTYYDNYTNNSYIVTFKIATNDIIKNSNEPIYRIKSSLKAHNSIYNNDYIRFRIAYSYDTSNEYKIAAINSDNNRDYERLVIFEYCTTRPTAQNTGNADNKYYVVDKVYTNDDTGFDKLKSDVSSGGNPSRYYYRWMTYNAKQIPVSSTDSGLIQFADHNNLPIDDGKVISYASRAVVPEHSKVESNVQVYSSKANKKAETSNRATETHASGSGEESRINPEYYDLEREINISSGALPEFVDEEDGTKAGNRNYVRFVVRPKKVAEARYTYTMEPVAAENIATEGKFEWVGMTFTESQAVAGSTEEKYLNYFKEKLTNLTTEQKDTALSKIDQKKSEYKQLYSTLNVEVYDYYVLELQNTNLFKKNVLGLAYLNSDVLQGKDISGYTFRGWFTDKYGVNPFKNEGITSNVTLYAKWEAVGLEGKPSCTITFAKGDLPDDAVVKNMPSNISYINNGAKICEPDSIPTTAGKIFAGWYDEAGNKFDFANTTITKQNQTLTAHWEDVGSDRFSFRFETNITSITGVKVKDGTWPTDLGEVVAINGMKVLEDGTFAVVGEGSPELVKSNGDPSDYEFSGWYLDSECTEKFSFDDAQATLQKFKEAGRKSIVLYARWIKADSLPNYTVKFVTNEPSTAKTTATGLSTYLGDSNELVVKHGDKVTIKKNKRTITDVNSIIPSLKGNVQDKIEKYVVEVITVTPDDLKVSDNLRLIDRANLIVLSESYDSTLVDTWKKSTSTLGVFRNADRFPKTSYTRTDTSFITNDLDWNTTLRILSRITGMRRKSDDTVEKVTTCPVLYDYAIYNSITGTTNTTSKTNVTTGITFTGSDTDSKAAAGYSSNIYKLYLMTQQVNPATVFNAYIRKSNVSGTINSSGTLSDGGSISGTNTGNYWNKYTLVPWKEISKADYSADVNNALSLIGFRENVELDADTSTINNRMFIYNETEAPGFAKGIGNQNETVIGVDASMSDVFGTAAETRSYNTSEAIYYLLKSKTQYDNYSHNLNVLDIEPGNNSKSNDYWFWYISRYVPNYTGTTTVTTMSTAEFICNIDDLNSQYDVLYIGADTTVKKFQKNETDGNVSYLPDSNSITPDVTAQSYYTTTNNNGTGATAKNYRLINAVKGMNIDKKYYVIKDVKVSTETVYEFSNTNNGGTWKSVTMVDFIKPTGLNSSGVDFTFDSSKLPTELRDKVTITIDREKYTTFDGYSYCLGMKKGYGDDPTNDWQYFSPTIDVKINGVSCIVSMERQDDSNIRYSYKVGANWADWEDYRVRFDVTFYYRAVPNASKNIYIVQEKNSGNCDTTGQIFVPTDAKIKHELVYSHVGEESAIGDGRAEYGLVAAEGTSFDHTVYSGNDITFKKYKEIAKFLAAGYPVIIGKNLFVAPGSNKINTTLVDSASWMYKLLKELSESTTGSPYYWYREDDSSHDTSFRKALSNKVFHLDVEHTPNEYRDLTNADSIAAHLTADDVYINGPSNPNNRTLEFTIKIDAEESDRSYMLRMFTDTNADGRYDIENELLDSVQIKDLTAGRSGIAASMVLQSGHTYQVSRTLNEDYTGIIPWKLQVLEVDSHKNPTGVYDDATGMAAIRVDASNKEILYVLQITSEINANTGSNQYKTNVFFPTDEEVMKNDPAHSGTLNFTGKSAGINYKQGGTTTTYDYDLDSSAWNSDTRDNMQQFYKYTYNLAEFEVHFLRVSITKRSPGTGRTDARNSLQDIAGNNDLVIGPAYRWTGTSYEKIKDVKWSDINMLILGYADCFNDIADSSGNAYTASLDMIKDFIEGGKTTLFTHDTTSPVNGHFVSNNYYDKWGKNINAYFRDFLGMDRFGVMKNKESSTKEQVAARVPDTLKNANDFANIKISTAGNYDIDYDVPFKPNTAMDLYGTNGTSVNEGNLATNNHTVLTQGLINRTITTKDNNTINSTHGRVTQNNSGQIVVYPYTIGKLADDYSIRVGETHSQYYQLNMEDEEIVVWYSVYKNDNATGQDFQKLVNDGSNNYYIYNKGNITYSGVGHQAKMTDEEYKLFVNTMIAAYNSRVRATEPIIKNSDKSTDANSEKDYIYVDFDATVSEDMSTTPVGGDIEKKSIGGVEYYTKRVEFELRNYSIIMNKFMTVHFYPVVYDKDNLDANGNAKRVVLYDYPIPLVVKKVDDDDNPANDVEATKCVETWTKEQIEAVMGRAPTAGETNYSNMLFAYKMPNGKIGKTAEQRAKENYDIVGVSKGTAYEVVSLEQYYVEIPISNEYYKSVLHLPDNYVYYPDEDSATSGATKTLYSKGPGVADANADYDKDGFGIDKQNSFEIEIQVVMRFGRDQTRNMPYVGTRGIVFLRRGMFTLD